MLFVPQPTKNAPISGVQHSANSLIQVNVKLPAPLHGRMAQLATEQRKTISELYTEAAEMLLATFQPQEA